MGSYRLKYYEDEIIISIYSTWPRQVTLTHQVNFEEYQDMEKKIIQMTNYGKGFLMIIDKQNGKLG